jgi:alkaline phosphatase D
MVGTCNDQDLAQDHWEPMLAARPHLAILAGDNVYTDVVLHPDGKLKGFEASPERVKAAYAKLGADPGWQKFRAAVPVVATWDDHDYGLNDAGAELAFKAESQAMFLDFFGAAADDPRRSRPGVYTEAWANAGNLRVQVLLLDVRSFRSPLKTVEKGVPTPNGKYLEDADPEKTMLGADQWAWLEDRLRQKADVRLIVSGTQVLSEGHGYERWGNLPHERQRLVELIGTTGANGVVFVSGDRHFGEILRDDTDVPYPMWELSSSSLNKSFGGRPDEPAPLRVGPQVAGENYGIIEVDPASTRVRLALVGIDGVVATEQVVDLAALRP